MQRIFAAHCNSESALRRRNIHQSNDHHLSCMSETRTRIAHLRDLAKTFRNVSHEYAASDREFAKRLADVAAELEQEAAERERQRE